MGERNDFHDFLDAANAVLGARVRAGASDEQLGRLVLACIDADLLDEIVALIEPDDDKRAELWRAVRR